MSKLTRRFATTTATIAVAGGVIFAAGNAASAAVESPAHTAAIDAGHSAARPDSADHRWDGHRWWVRYGGHGDWYSTDHGVRYRFDGHRFYQWNDGRWKPLSADAARHRGLDRGDFSGRGDHDGSG